MIFAKIAHLAVIVAAVTGLMSGRAAATPIVTVDFEGQFVNLPGGTASVAGKTISDGDLYSGRFSYDLMTPGIPTINQTLYFPTIQDGFRVTFGGMTFTSSNYRVSVADALGIAQQDSIDVFANDIPGFSFIQLLMTSLGPSSAITSEALPAVFPLLSIFDDPSLTGLAIFPQVGDNVFASGSTLTSLVQLPTAVPEPPTAWLFMIALAAIGCVTRGRWIG